MSAKQEAGIHYNLHNMYGHTEGIATKHGLETVGEWTKSHERKEERMGG